MLIGLDGCQDRDRVWHAYNDNRGVTRRFILNGLAHANKILGAEVFVPDDWEYVIKQGEKIRVEESYKYSAGQRAQLWQKAGLNPFAIWGARSVTNKYYIHMVVSVETGSDSQV
ncbi:hypothetical protein MMC22_010274 [Lobaria immixta]|nr:hypothetical protein [Lobaria immixta]